MADSKSMRAIQIGYQKNPPQEGQEILGYDLKLIYDKIDTVHSTPRIKNQDPAAPLLDPVINPIKNIYIVTDSNGENNGGGGAGIGDKGKKSYLLCGCGSNNFGQLGNNNPSSQDWHILSKLQFAQVKCGTEFTAAIDMDGYLYTWGKNTRGQLGTGDRTNKYTIRRTSSKKWKTVSCGNEHLMAIDENNKLWCCGSNDYGQLGLTGRKLARNINNADFSSREQFENTTNFWYGGQQNIQPKDYDWILILRDEEPPSPWPANQRSVMEYIGDSWVFKYGYSGDIDYQRDKLELTQVDDRDWKLLSTGLNFSTGINTEGVFSTGQNQYGQLGLRDAYQRYEFTMITEYEDDSDIWGPQVLPLTLTISQNIQQLVAGNDQNAFILDSSIYVTGIFYNTEGSGNIDLFQGRSSTKNYKIQPYLLHDFIDTKAYTSGLGAGHQAYIVDNSGSLSPGSFSGSIYGSILYNAGNNSNGILGSGDLIQRYTPEGNYQWYIPSEVAYTNPWIDNEETQVFGKGRKGYIIINESPYKTPYLHIGYDVVGANNMPIPDKGMFWSRGVDSKNDGFYNNDLIEDAGTKIILKSIKMPNFKYVVCGNNHTLGITEFGQLLGTGNNSKLVLGGNSTAIVLYMSQLSPFDNWLSISSSSSHSIGIVEVVGA